MPNPSGTPIWYELMTPDPDGAKRFYDDVVGWTIGPKPADGAPDYRMIGVPGGPAGGHVGGVMRLDEDMAASGAKAGWLLYFNVEDVDAAAGKAEGLGAHGRSCRRPTSPMSAASACSPTRRARPSTSCAPAAREPRPCSPRASRAGAAGTSCGPPTSRAALAFYGAMFGWENRETMDMGAMGGYHFIDLGETRLGAAAEMKDRPAGWNFYFNVANIDAAVERVRGGGGAVEMGPHEVPTRRAHRPRRRPAGRPLRPGVAGRSLNGADKRVAGQPTHQLGPVLVRNAREADVASLREILFNTFESTWAPRVTPAAARRFREKDRPAAFAAERWRECQVAERRGEVVGFVFWRDDFVHSLHVRSHHARSGVGAALMDVAERQIAQAGFAKARLETDTFNAASRAFYAARGYLEAGRYPDEEWASGLTTLLLVKRLS